MDGFDGLDLDITLLDSSASDALGVVNFNTAGDFNAVMSMFSDLNSGNFSFDDFSNDTFWDSNDSFNGFNDFINDYFGWDGDDQPPEPDPDDEPPGPGNNEPLDEVISIGTVITPFNLVSWVLGLVSGLFGGSGGGGSGGGFSGYGDGGGGNVIPVGDDPTEPEPDTDPAPEVPNSRFEPLPDTEVEDRNGDPLPPSGHDENGNPYWEGPDANGDGIPDNIGRLIFPGGLVYDLPTVVVPTPPPPPPPGPGEVS
ncbi:MAG: hypothetical protein L3J05_02440 [Robiginitomaculum sp.]|nr:hypothetical protein [Robiginitomaculum sp.]